MGPTLDVAPLDLSNVTVNDIERLDNPALKPVLLQVKKHLDGEAAGAPTATQFAEFLEFGSSY